VDSQLVERLTASDIDTTFRREVPWICVPFDDYKRPVLPEDDAWIVRTHDRNVTVGLKPMRDLWTGNVQPPDLAGRPPREYLPFFSIVELTAAEFCAATEIRVTDKEFERLYSLLRRRPDGRDGNPLHAFLHAAARLYMSLRATSQAEFEAVMHRLEKSARTFAMGWTSSNYAVHAILPRFSSGDDALEWDA
jgi:hypothetical protein